MAELRRWAIAITKSLVWLTALVASFAFARWACAVEFGNYPGLSDMIKYSQSIVVVSILSGPDHTRTHSENQWAVQTVKVLSVLKGDLRGQDEIDVKLMPFLLLPEPAYTGLTDFPVNERYILFLATDYFSPGLKNSIVNAKGSAFWLPRSVDLSGLKTGNARGNIEMLVNATLSYATSLGLNLDECIHAYLSDEPDLGPLGHHLSRSCAELRR